MSCASEGSYEMSTSTDKIRYLRVGNYTYVFDDDLAQLRAMQEIPKRSEQTVGFHLLAIEHTLMRRSSYVYDHALERLVKDRHTGGLLNHLLQASREARTLVTGMYLEDQEFYFSVDQPTLIAILEKFK